VGTRRHGVRAAGGADAAPAGQAADDAGGALF